MTSNDRDLAREALNKIASHEDICDLRYRQIQESMVRMETSSRDSHVLLHNSVVDIAKAIRNVLVYAVLGLGGTTAALIVYIFLNMRSTTQ